MKFEEALKQLREGKTITSLVKYGGQYELNEEGVLFNKGISTDYITIKEILGDWM